MTKITINLINSLLDKVRISSLINEGVIANILCLSLANSVGIKSHEVYKNSAASNKQFEEALLSRLQNFDECVANAVKSLLTYKIDDKCFNLLVSEILENPIWKSRQQSTTDYLIDVVLCEQLQKDIQTPAWLNHLAISLVNPVYGSFYDGAAGGAGTAVAAYRHAQKQQGDLEIYTQEIYEFLYLVSVIRTFLEYIPRVSLACGDTIQDPKHLENGILQTFDYSIMFSPLGMTKMIDASVFNNDMFNRFTCYSTSRISWDWAFALHQIASLNEKGKGILCMFSGSLFNAQNKDIRSDIIQSGVIECIISMPANSLSFSPVPLNLIVFNKRTKKNSQILMIDAQDLMQTTTLSSYKKRFTLNNEGIKKIVEIYSQKSEIKRISKIVPIAELQDANLMPTNYIEKITFETSDFGKISVLPNIDQALSNSNWKKIKDVAEIHIGLNIFKVAEQSNEGNTKIIKLSDVQDGILHLENIERYQWKKEVKLKNYQVQFNDVLLSCKGPAVKTCMVPQTDDFLVASANFVILRVKPEIMHPTYLKYYLESPMGMYFIKSKQTGSSIVMINTRNINEIPVPYIPLHEQIKLVSELQLKDDYIQREIADLSQKLKESRLNFYKNIGLLNVMTIVEEDKR